jgi:MarR family 2-MHQ and catechol resistance regulon transcriptional repressor
MGTHYVGTADEIRALNAYIKLERATDAVTSRINAHLSDHGLTVSQFGILESLHHLGPMCQKDLASKILKSTGNITFVIDNLVKRNLVRRQRDTNDRRFITIHLTDEGDALISEIFPEHVQIVTREMSFLSPAEQEALGQLCRKVGLGEAEPVPAV